MPLQQAFQLSLGQQFQMHKTTAAVEHASRSDLADLVVELTRQLMIKDNVIRHLIKNDTADLSELMEPIESDKN
jgi:ribosomal protein S6